jgi:hypothetical protein
MPHQLPTPAAGIAALVSRVRSAPERPACFVVDHPSPLIIRLPDVSFNDAVAACGWNSADLHIGVDSGTEDKLAYLGRSIW